ncbi:MAG: type III pantothenate kinase [Campylobacterales bacterium]|nr:type III pantothenate kinase [Campylobacterales bacterium]
MYLCDIGNSNVHFFKEGRMWAVSVPEFQHFSTQEPLFFINVNESVKPWLVGKKNYVDLEPYFAFDTIYQGIGVDRVAACYTVEEGIVIDAGSAITVDIMSGGLHLGGYILAGLSAAQEAYASISPRLDVRINPNITLDALPQKTADAVSYGVIKPILLMLGDTCKEKNIYFTGGDGKFLSRFFKHSIFDKTLIFRGMQKAIAHSGLVQEG